MLQTRRDVLKSAALVTASFGAGALAADAPKELIRPATPATPGSDRWKGLKAGVASYSLRGMPLDAAVEAIQRVDLHYVSIKDKHLKLTSTTEERKAVAKLFRDAGITPISCGVITIKDEATARNAFEYARDIGVPTIVCAPEPSTLPIVEKLVKEFDIRIAIHNHGPEAKIFKTPTEVWDAVKSFDPRIGICMDVGHTARAGENPAEAMRKYKARLYDCHFKDVNSPTGKNAGVSEVEIGRGVLDIKAMLQALVEVKYDGHLGFEHEKTATNPLPGLAESVGYTKGILSCL